MNFKPNWKLVSIGLVVMLLQLFLYVNVKSFFHYAGSADDEILYQNQMRWTLLLYMVITFGVSMVMGGLPAEVKAPVIPQLLSFFIFFFIFAAMLWKMPITAVGSHMFQISDAVVIALPIMLVFAFVVGYTEELVFRASLPKILGDLISNLLFAVFHWYSYGGNVLAVAVAFIFGMIFSLLRDKFGLMGSVGAHTAWNLKILGAF